jgi:prepilin-type N-terminal cleavage/methylation domain-containing protein
MRNGIARKKLPMTAERGFTLVELAIATVVLLVGAVAVMQLVPAAMQSNLNNRYDSAAAVLAQQLLDQISAQPLTATEFLANDGRVIQLGSAAFAGQVQGGPVRIVRGMAQINFTADAVPGFNFQAVDENDATGTSYEVRWAVITTVSPSGTIVAKRFIVGAWRRDSREVTQPVTVDAWVQR